MSTKTTNRRVNKAEIQKNAVRLALVIFFAATVSAAGGFLQGEQVASTQSRTNLAAVTVSVSNEKIKETNFTFDSGHIYTTRSTGDRSEIGRYSCTSGSCSGQVTVTDSTFEFVEHTVPIEAGCIGSECELAVNGNSEPLDSTQEALLRNLLIDEGALSSGNSTAPGTAPTASSATPTATSTAPADTSTAPTPTINQCAEGKDPSCKNRCSTSYVTIEAGGPGNEFQTPESKDCYDKNANVDGAAKNLIKKLEQCIGSAGPGKPRIPESTLKKQLCETEKTAEIKDGKVEIIDNSLGNNTPLAIPESCTKYVEAINALRNGANAKTDVKKEDANSCSWKGAVVCYDKDGAGSGDTWECKKKADANTEAPGVEPPPPGSGGSGGFGGLGGLLDGLKKALGGLFGGGGGSPSGGGGSSGGGRSPFDDQQCPAGYVETNVNGRATCEKEKTEKPQCILVPSKEKIAKGESVTLRWRVTDNADSVTITDIGTGLAKNSEKTITPEETTTYTLVVRNDAGSAECDTTITVDGEGSGPTGSAPPQLSCAPGTIKKGNDATVRWACTTGAISSVGSGIDTKGKVSGIVTVSPDHNTQYSVTCKSGDTELGTNQCAVSVGEPIYDILVYPTTAKRGDRVRVSWASLFMKSCTVQGPRGFDYTRPQGIVITEPFALDDTQVPNRDIRAAIYSIECESQFGGTFSRDVSVKFSE